MAGRRGGRKKVVKKAPARGKAAAKKKKNDTDDVAAAAAAAAAADVEVKDVVVPDEKMDTSDDVKGSSDAGAGADDEKEASSSSSTSSSVDAAAPSQDKLAAAKAAAEAMLANSMNQQAEAGAASGQRNNKRDNRGAILNNNNNNNSNNNNNNNNAHNNNNNQRTNKKRRGHALTVHEILADSLTQLSLEYWAPGVEKKDQKAFDAKLVATIYNDELSSFDLSRVMLLELSMYLENFLWPNFDAATSSLEQVLSIVLMVNEKFRENVPAWKAFHSKSDDDANNNKFSAFFSRVLGLCADFAPEACASQLPKLSRKLVSREREALVCFFTNAFQSLGDELVRRECLRVVSLPMWHALTPSRRARELKAFRLAAHWEVVLAREKEGGDAAKNLHLQSVFIPSLISYFLKLVEAITPENAKKHMRDIRFCERVLDFSVDLLSQLRTRRFFLSVVQDYHLVVRCRQAKLHDMPQGRLFKSLIENVFFYQGFEINSITGQALTDHEMTSAYCARMQSLQRIAFRDYQSELKSLALSNLASLQSRDSLKSHLDALSDESLRSLCVSLGVAATADDLANDDSDSGRYVSAAASIAPLYASRQFLMEELLLAYEKRPSQLEALNRLPIYPTEAVLWDYNKVPLQHYTGEVGLALPKLNLQFLTFHDYLLRNFNLFRLEATYQIREDIENIVKRSRPRKVLATNKTIFEGWARQALPVKDFNLTRIGTAHIGEPVPSVVKAEITIDLQPTNNKIRDEWEELRQHDILFLLTIKSPIHPGHEADQSLPFDEQQGVAYVRGCEVELLLDAEDNIVDTFMNTQPRKGTTRKIKVWMDPASYQSDMDKHEAGGEDVYRTFNLLMRRKPKENNFKAVLQCIRDLMNSRELVVPEWLHDVFLGYGDPSASARVNSLRNLDFVDTFVDLEHLKDSFPGKKVDCGSFSEAELVPPFKVTLPKTSGDDDDDDDDEDGDAAMGEGDLKVVPYTRPNPGPYPVDAYKTNAIRFTPVQTNAIESGIHEGLTLVVGPPGTGKTDVAVQTISNLYHNFPNQRILLVTHSNQALNQLFEKIVALDIDPRHLVRLGHGHEDLETKHDHSKRGQVNYMLDRRLHCLSEVDRLAQSLDVEGDVGSTCETASYFYLNLVLAKWEKFLEVIKAPPAEGEEVDRESLILLNFPFSKFFADAPNQPLLRGDSYDQDMATAEGCFRHLQRLFDELKDLRPFELLRSFNDRVNYLVTTQARIIAMTCTHAALKRHDMVDMDFKYDTLVMEESAQILEIETFIPMLMQRQRHGDKCRLKRCVLIGDHNQLPPVVKNMAFQRYAHLDQSLFARFIRLEVPSITLDCQGRARPSLAKLYNWRYDGMGDLPNVSKGEFTLANAGLAHEYQLIDVPDYQGRGEHSPVPHFFQNLGEAEYVVATYIYMRMCGIPASKISILTTYNGQKHLLRDVLNARCANDASIGLPSMVSTVDRYQGQQNDYVLLSLVRTDTVGHIRDVRRLVVAMSRARLGVYVFCRRSLFENCYELTETFSLLLERPVTLSLVEGEKYGQVERKVDGSIPDGALKSISGVEEMFSYIGAMGRRLHIAGGGAETAADATTTADSAGAAGNASAPANAGYGGGGYSRGGGGGGGQGVCYSFQKGNCDRGESCRFSHTEGGGGGGGGSRGGGGGHCYDFQKGNCSRGDSCKFSHTDGGGGGGGGFRGGGGGGGSGGGGGGHCYDFQKGNCSRGDSCRFSHTDGGSSGGGGGSRGGGGGACYDFQKGNCTRGDGCKFSH